MKETDLYQPVKELFEKMGYSVNGEVADMDVTAVRGEELVVVELKKSMNLTLLLQATNRQKITEQVYIAIPRPVYKKRFSQTFKDKEHLLRRLSLGLILVALDSPVPYAKIAFEPKPFKSKASSKNIIKKTNTLREINRRHGDYNTGGSNRQNIVTAYRENALKIAGLVEIAQKISMQDLRAAGGGQKTRSILNKNYYGWFVKDDDDLYGLTKKAPMDMENYRELINLLLSEYITKDNRIICVRKAKISEAKLLTEISFKAKRYWRYPEEYYKVWSEELTIKQDYIRSNTIFITEIQSVPVGYYSIVENKVDFWAGDVFVQKGFWLDHMYVLPEYMNIGVGKRLYRHMKAYGKENSIDRIRIFVDPYAKGFYDQVGARYIEEVPSSIKDRMIPLYEVCL